MAVLKHVLLSNYLHPFIAMVTNADPSVAVTYIDAYAGPGAYKASEDEPSEPGSPLIALGAANSLSSVQRPRILNCIFIERKKAYADSLRAICDTGRFSGTHRVVHSDAKDAFVEQVKSVGQGPLLAFIDPFGTAFPHRVLGEALEARRRTKTEVLFNFHLSSVARIGGLLGNAVELKPSDQKTVDRLDAFLGFDWREHFFAVYKKGEQHSATRAAQAVALEFRSMMFDRHGMHSLGVDVRKAGDLVPRFELTLFFHDDAAGYKFADAAQAANAAWRKRVSESEERKHAAQYLDALIGADFDREQFLEKWKADERRLAAAWEAAIAGNIVRLLTARPSIGVGASVQELYGEVLGLAGEKHIRAAWKSLASKQITNDCPRELMYSSIVRGPGWSPPS